ALIYIAAEVIPDAGLMRDTFKGFPRRRRIHELEAAVQDNPSAGNYEELGDLYLEEGRYAHARKCFDKSISARTDSPDPFYRRGLPGGARGGFSAPAARPARGVDGGPPHELHPPPALRPPSYATPRQPQQ